MAMLRAVLLAETVLVLLVMLPQARAALAFAEANHPGIYYLILLKFLISIKKWNFPVTYGKPIKKIIRT